MKIIFILTLVLLCGCGDNGHHVSGTPTQSVEVNPSISLSISPSVSPSPSLIQTQSPTPTPTPTPKEIKESIKFTNLSVSKPDSAGGVDVEFSFDNMTEKTVKYVRMLAYPYNAVNDRVPCDIYGFKERWLKYTGPLESGCNSDENYFETVWYNNSIVDLKLAIVEVEFTDGETIHYRNEKEINKLFYE